MIFLSYARGDDEPFVKYLYENLTAQGVQVWWDRVSMPSRALTFLQEIRDAIAAADRLVVVIGPSAVESDYVRPEWEFALTVCKIVIPILRLGDFDSLPPELRKLHCPDFRSARPQSDALGELLRILSGPVAPLGNLRGVPALPPHFLPRPEEIDRLSERVLADVNTPTVITSARQTTALQGMGGLGKSVLAAAFARACETRRAFTHGVVWISLGQRPDLQAVVGQIAEALDSDVSRGIAKILEDKACLLVLDDTWEVRHAEPVVNALGSRCRLLITTRDGGLASNLGAQVHRLDVLPNHAALQLLAEWSGQAAERMPAEAGAVAEECGYLPFALALAGAMVRDDVSWTAVLQALREADLGFLERQFPNYPYRDLLKSLSVSVDALARSDPAGARHYLDLAVFPPAMAVPEAAVMTLWRHGNGLSERAAQKLLSTLDRKALLRLEGDAPARRVSLHDLQRDYIYTVRGDPRSGHVLLLAAYRQRCPDGWPSGPNDGYFFEHLAHHLIEADCGQELRGLLLDSDWLQAHLAATGVARLIASYDLLPDDRDLRRVQGALRLSAHILSADPTQLAGQLLGRLRCDESEALQPFLDQLRRWRAVPWLRPLAASLTPPGGPLLRTLNGHENGVCAVAITADGQRVVSASSDKTLRVWDMASGIEVRTLRGHSDGVLAVTLTPDGKRAVSGSRDGSLKVWDLDKGEALKTLQGHSGPVLAVALIANSRRVLSGAADHTLKLWDLDQGVELQTWSGHANAVKAIAVSQDARYVVSAADDGNLIVWNASDGAVLRTFAGHKSAVHAVAFLPNGRHLVSASGLTVEASGFGGGDFATYLPFGYDNVLILWDVETGTTLRKFEGHNYVVWSVAVTPDGSRAISASGDNTLKIWDLRSGAVLRELRGHTEERTGVTCVAVAPGGRQAVSASADSTLKIWDLESSQQLPVLASHSSYVSKVLVLSTGRQAVSASADGTLKLWDLAEGAQISSAVSGLDAVRTVLPIPGDSRALICSYAGKAKEWDFGNNSALRDVEIAWRPLAVFPDGKRVLTSSVLGTLEIWELESNTRLFEFEREPDYAGHINALVLTRDGALAVAASDSGYVIVWDLERGVRICKLDHSYPFQTHAVAVTPDSSTILSGSHDGSIKVWDLHRGAECSILRGHSGEVRDLALTPDSKRLVSAATDGTIRVWDLTAMNTLAAFNAESPLYACAVSPDGLKIIAGDATGRVHLLDYQGADEPPAE